jgi:hypothetical protein
LNRGGRTNNSPHPELRKSQLRSGSTWQGGRSWVFHSNPEKGELLPIGCAEFCGLTYSLGQNYSFELLNTGASERIELFARPEIEERN